MAKRITNLILAALQNLFALSDEGVTQVTQRVQKEKFPAYTRKCSGYVVEICFSPNRMDTGYSVQVGMPCALPGSTDRS